VVELRWRLEFSFEGKLAWGCMGEGAPKLISGCRRSPEALGFELEIKSGFN
jgi:hypothetical protein